MTPTRPGALKLDPLEMIASESGFGDLEGNLKGLTFLYHFLALTLMTVT